MLHLLAAGFIYLFISVRNSFIFSKLSLVVLTIMSLSKPSKIRFCAISIARTLPIFAMVILFRNRNLVKKYTDFQERAW